MEITLRLPEDVRNSLERCAEQEGRSAHDVVLRAVEHYLAERGEQPEQNRPAGQAEPTETAARTERGDDQAPDPAEGSKFAARHAGLLRRLREPRGTDPE